MYIQQLSLIANLNKVYDSENFKEITQRLCDLADHVDEKFSSKSISPPSSLKKKNKLKNFKGKPRRVTWGQEPDREKYFDSGLEADRKSFNSSVKKKSGQFFKNLTNDGKL